ncbi:MAG: N-6 DNA methylase, partial [Caldiserica bacterium]|nr:N-6 DNA methylase [Caldisericota bacterium]
MGGFVDLFSQTIVYGLFAARMRAGENFDRRHAYDNIPKTIGILSELFEFISLGKIPDQMKWTIEDIANVLSAVDVKRIFSEYYHSGKGKDPVVYFYETFLSVYNPDLRERRGVYYTPEPVVTYIVNSLNEILKDKINIEGGLSDRRVTVLDPAAGTLSFITE